MSASPASNPKSPDISEKNKKYDRQLRLWGDHGQAALESASVCLINATATGTETLKSLVLAGLGSFTIVDGKIATAEDIGNNFFLPSDCAGESRGRSACRLLLELNPDVRGQHVEQPLERLLDTEPDRLQAFSVVVATELTDSCLSRLSEVLWSHNVPLLVARSYGLVGSIRLQVREHLVVESHPDPDSVVADLRLLQPFPALAAFCDSQQLEAMDRAAHGHTPFLVLLYKALQRWRDEHDGAPPSGYREKKQFKETLQQFRLRTADGVPELEENFDEAERAVNTLLTPPSVPEAVRTLFASQQCNSLTAKSDDFWVLVKALHEYVENEGEGLLPVRGPIPDMFSDSDRYIQLQNIYREEARRGADQVQRHVHLLLESLGRPSDVITEEQVRHFCRNTHALRVFEGTAVQQELRHLRLPANEMAAHLQNPESEMVIYAMLRAAERFRSEYSTAPGAEDDQVETDVIKLKACLSRLLSDWGCQNTIKDDYVQEFCRYGGSELHTVAALIGGCAAHEVIKLVTGQYAPIDNTFIYNGISSSSAVFRL
ncbi:NEDD8-activating enzyme E1 regulatory subunit-like isoform X2 [Amphibalanus amphitrite]|uniref:NEDD8-activating enzyme E1 regulatory subunit-like isoform X2 n=1 Tax=Amphibalanus amphitrite TaxID=1232801 RepID=UPI001C926374|nr:NEDD8-activating enzyme E1 regulatory subunit-like isoform X2 [Amphibalanus amphitrite]